MHIPYSAECRVTSDGPVTPASAPALHLNMGLGHPAPALSGPQRLGGVSWLDATWIFVGTVVIAAAAATIFVLGAYVFGLL
jgi:hypothetical protein